MLRWAPLMTRYSSPKECTGAPTHMDRTLDPKMPVRSRKLRSPAIHRCTNRQITMTPVDGVITLKD
jgi:hypothetical protein